MTQLTPRDDIKKQVSEILKLVDNLIRNGSVDQAIREIVHAKEIDPSNSYVKAYEERLEFLRTEHEKNIEKEKGRKEVEKIARKRDQELRLRQEEDRTRLIQEQQRLEKERKSRTRQITTGIEHKIKDEPIRPEPQLIKNCVNTILVIDDDRQLLEMISQTLSSHDFEVISLTTSDEAFTLLQKLSPGLILCDVNLETSTRGGFSFYESIRKLKHLNKVPFIFLTGLNDHVIMRTGKEMGVDDYLTKPITEEDLVATIKGKLKRFAIL